MKVKRAEVLLVDLPLMKPFETSFGRIDKRPTVLVKLISEDGLVGWGEAAALPLPMYSWETTDTVVVALRNYLLPKVIGKELKSVNELMEIFGWVKGHNFAKCGLECAFWCLWSLKTGKSLKSLFGGKKERIGVGESIGIKQTVEETLVEVKKRVGEGYQRIKLKIKPGWDVDLVKAVRKEFGKVSLMVDGNSSYTLADVVVLKKLDKYRLMMIEQPLGDGDMVDHARLQRELKTPICLDESVVSADDARKAVEIEAAKIINIKPGRVGGIIESIKIHNYCRKKDIPVWCGGMLESGIGRSFNIALASLAGFSLPADMSPSSIFYKDDLVNPSYKVDNRGYIKVPDKQGLGYEVNERKVKEHTRKSYTV